jgi:four helix bundle protein
MKEYKKLIVWQKSINLVKLVYELSKDLPKSEEYGLVSQIKRAVVSIPANIAEANGRNSEGERKQFLGIAQGSAFELETELIILVELKLINEIKINDALLLLDEIQRMLASLINKVSRSSKSPHSNS